MNRPVYIIAEIGINFNGDFNTCCRLIDAAVAAGCNAVKFQLFKAQTLYPRSAGQLDWQDGTRTYRYDIFKAVGQNELPRDWVEPLMSYCHGRDIDFLASVFSPDDARFLLETGVGALKLSSSSVTNLPLVDVCAATGVPLIVSTGGSTLGEVEAVVETVRRHHQRLTLLHCSLQYPTAPHNCNLGVIETLARAFPDCAIGYSDHTTDPVAVPVQAVYLGATVIEKHITLDRGMPGPDHFFALEPKSLIQMVAAIREAERRRIAGPPPIDPLIYGSSAKRVGDHEAYLRGFVENQLFARREIAKGQTIAPDDLIVLRRGKKPSGLPPVFLKLFTDHTVTASRPIAMEEPIIWEQLL